YDHAAERAEAIRVDEGRTLIHPFDDPLIIAGQGTLGSEIVEAMPDVAEIVVALSGGGLAGGVAAAAKELQSDVAITAVSAERAAGHVGESRSGQAHRRARGANARRRPLRRNRPRQCLHVRVGPRRDRSARHRNGGGHPRRDGLRVGSTAPSRRRWWSGRAGCRTFYRMDGHPGSRPVGHRGKRGQSGAGGDCTGDGPPIGPRASWRRAEILMLPLVDLLTSTPSAHLRGAGQIDRAHEGFARSSYWVRTNQTCTSESKSSPDGVVIRRLWLGKPDPPTRK
ncbi:MAG TPA: pyridoxal-phosphate dependent enzyme, partial [Gemmatimonadetes bacterium]|nr:pyridoxal-phosphate dependent enzyme [Gemmatimonadota bacterium]